VNGVALRQYLSLARRWLPLLIICMVIGAVVAFAIVSAQAPRFEATATLRLGQPGSANPIMITQVSDRLIAEYAYRSTTREALVSVAEDLGLPPDPESLRDRVSVSVQPGSTLLSISVIASTAEEASDLANALAQRLIDYNRTSQQTDTQLALNANIETLLAERDRVAADIARLSQLGEGRSDLQDARLADLEDMLVTLIAAHGTVLDDLLATGAHSLAFLTEAVPPESPGQPPLTIFVVLGLAAGLLVGVGLAAVLQYVDDTVREPADLERATGLPTLGDVVEPSGDAARGGRRRLVTIGHPRSSDAEAYRRLRNTVELAASAEPIRTLLVTGSIPSTGTAVTAANLAVAFAEAGRRVLLVDADLRDPVMHALFELPNDHGLSTLLSQDGVVVDRLLIPTPVRGLRVLPSGLVPSNPAEALGSPRMRAVIEDFAATNDLVLVHGPELPTVTDAMVLGSFLQYTLLVVTRGRTRRGVVVDAISALEIGRAAVIGTVLYGQRRGARRSVPAPNIGADANRSGETRLGRAGPP
jgi:capsular exopolysaccharide synthesis family protein